MFNGNPFAWGGALGDTINNWLSGFLGKIGTGVLLAIAGFVYFIWRFNPAFKVPQKKTATYTANELDTETGDNNELQIKGNFLKYFLLFIIIEIMVFLGSVTVIGMLFVIPFVNIILVVAYRKLIYSHLDVDDDLTETL